jgi:hypothetical protein
MVGEFNNYNPGHYVVHWRIKTLQNFSVPNGLHFVVNVSYDVRQILHLSVDSLLPFVDTHPHAMNRLSRRSQILVVPWMSSCLQTG